MCKKTEIKRSLDKIKELQKEMYTKYIPAVAFVSMSDTIRWHRKRIQYIEDYY